MHLRDVVARVEQARRVSQAELSDPTADELALATLGEVVVRALRCPCRELVTLADLAANELQHIADSGAVWCRRCLR